MKVTFIYETYASLAHKLLTEIPATFSGFRIWRFNTDIIKPTKDFNFDLYFTHSSEINNL